MTAVGQFGLEKLVLEQSRATSLSLSQSCITLGWGLVPLRGVGVPIASQGHSWPSWRLARK